MALSRVLRTVDDAEVLTTPALDARLDETLRVCRGLSRGPGEAPIGRSGRPSAIDEVGIRGHSQGRGLTLSSIPEASSVPLRTPSIAC